MCISTCRRIVAVCVFEVLGLLSSVFGGMSEVGVCVWKQRNLIGDVCVFWNPGLEVL